MEDNLPSYHIIKDTPKILPSIYTDCLQPSVIKVGKALETVLELSNTILLPLKILNEKAKIIFQKNIKDYEEKLNSIEEKDIIDVEPIIGSPILDRLSYITNSEIVDLFTSLLAKASSFNMVNQVHPVFIHIIDRLSIDEARLIKHFTNLEYIVFINLIHRVTSKPSSYQEVGWNLTGLEFDVELINPQNIDIYLDNLSSLNIISHQGGTFKDEDERYVNIENYYKKIIDESNEIYKNIGNYNECEITKGFYKITDLGKCFINACCKMNN